jgi:tRNA threonylcarbamoyl adenosine modification protein YeaZ
MNKQFIIIDTSGPDSFVVLSKNGRLFIEYLPPMKQSETLLPALQKLLENEVIDFIAVGTGPGSFTGTRVGVMTAKTLAFAKDLPLLPFCSLILYTPSEEGPFTIYTDALSGKCYALSGNRTKEGVTYEAPTMIQGSHKLSNKLNLDFLRKYLFNKFIDNEGISKEKTEVYYLKS